ncbi:glycosyltransferase family 4 protein [Demequina mangrovi]|uniref:Glycosyltransferase involved in cell wall bisynthesis n=1 Tax=Demequina mangrovi TaxID=1043493 RepID=A0A1H6YHN0_9MICO|nr:glycosyltransferase family 4 protein [Demequina mangrovi]SEJ39916.1 Glycosyltransferase involved in cell wall bisynthesis [Demequina mangrovi]
MRVLLVTHRFAPDVGGIERMSELLATQFAEQGHTVTVVTHSTARDVDDAAFGFTMLRRPTPSALLRAHRDADVVFHNNICLQFIWPLLLARRPLVIAVRTWISRMDGRVSARDVLKQKVLARAHVISISAAIAEHLSTASTVIPNSYRDDVFFDTTPVAERRRTFAFVGRLVSDKGADLAIETIARLVAEGRPADLTVIGDGPEREALETLAIDLGIETQVRFTGELTGPEVCGELNAHRFVLVPSRWAEPFGVVALEAMACGCVPVVTRDGGLGEAAGAAGIVVPNGDLDALADAARQLVCDADEASALRAAIPSALSGRRSSDMGRRYLDVIERAAAGLPVR